MDFSRPRPRCRGRTYSDDPRGVLGSGSAWGSSRPRPTRPRWRPLSPPTGLDPLVEWAGFDPQPGPDAELLHVAIVDAHQFAGRVIAYHGQRSQARRPRRASAALDSVAATNGGFFTIDAPLAAVNGVNTGISAYNGQIESLADGDRVALCSTGIDLRDREPELACDPALRRQLDPDSRYQQAPRQCRGLRRAGFAPTASHVRTRSAPAPTTSSCSRRCSAPRFPRRRPRRQAVLDRRAGSSRSARRRHAPGRGLRRAGAPGATSLADRPRRAGASASTSNCGVWAGPSR